VRRLLLLAVALTLGYAIFVFWGLPSRSEVRALAKKNPGKTGVMRQREEEALAAKRKPRTLQSWVPLARVSRNLVQAVIVAEDAKFFGHEGIDWDAIKGSLEKDLEKRRFAQGGSTITQQLAKNLFFSTRKSVTRKLRELVVTRWLEDELAKKRILEIYLNVIEWGDGVYGCEAAAQRYYGKPAADLSPEEAAGLAAMIPSPRRINPRVNAAVFGRAQRRVLWLMARAGYVKRDLAGVGVEPPPEPADDSGPEPTEPEEPAPASVRETQPTLAAPAR
jgi:monofunctional biosynthetic peptidoglycan transglycosylase